MPSEARLRALIADLRWWSNRISWRANQTPWECGLISLLQQAADALDAALLGDASRQPTDQPVDPTGRGRFLLNAYGRQCFEDGYEYGKSQYDGPKTDKTKEK